MLAALATIACAYALARALLDRRRAVVTAVVLATSPMMLVFGRLVIFDMPLTTFVTIASYAMLRARLDDAAWRWLPVAGVALGAALLTKGPVGVVLPLIVWVAVRGVLPGRPSRDGGVRDKRWPVHGRADPRPSDCPGPHRIDRHRH
jgi:4-amino-4-deoxy-L-arabinose transferase-like glycosyltransferase